MKGEDLVSVIVPTYDNQETVATCLESIANQSYQNVEVIVVDGESSDLTLDICSRYDADIYETDLGMAAARKFGAQEADGDYLFHVDADMELTNNVVSECMDYIDDFDALIVPEVNVGSTYWARCTDVGKSISRNSATGHIRFLSKDLYFECGGHNPKLLYKEDRELHQLVIDSGAKVGHTTNRIYHHIGGMGLLSLLRKRSRYTKSLSDYHQHARIRGGPDVENEESALMILSRELFKRPNLIPGYLFLSLCTGILVRAYSAYYQVMGSGD